MIAKQPVEWRDYQGNVVTDISRNPHPFIRIVIANRSGMQSAASLAMIDTGQSNIEITKEIIDKLGLPRVGSIEIHGNKTTETVPIYACTVGVPNAPNVKVDLQAIEMTNHLKVPGCHAIVGMALLNAGGLVLQGPDRESFFVFLPERFSGELASRQKLPSV